MTVKLVKIYLLGIHIHNCKVCKSTRSISTFPFFHFYFFKEIYLYLEHGSLWLSQFMERWFACCHLYDGAAQGPYISRCPVTSRTFIDDLGGHVLQRAWTEVYQGRAELQ